MAASTPKKKAAKSGNPARKATTAKGWKRSKGEELELPSGNVALVKRPGPQALLSKGILPDTLMPIVQQAIRSGKGLRPQDEAEILKDPAALVGMLDGMDRLLAEVVVEPEVAYHKHLLPEGNEPIDIPARLRDGDTECECGATHPDGDEVIYTDEVDEDDKMFVFNYAVGGTRDLEQFRSEQAARLGNLSDGAGDADTSE